MQLTKKTFKEFLSFTSRHFRQLLKQDTQANSKVVLVFGNESADQDSLFGSQILAYIRYNQNISQDCLYVPVHNCQRSEIVSRFEFIDLTKSLAIPIEELIFVDELGENLQAIKDIEDLHTILYDHNIPAKGQQQQLKNTVIEIVDHHADQTESFYALGQLQFKDIRKIGSGQSILTHYFMADENLEHLLDEDIARILLTTIALDTYNFDEKLKTERWNELDIQAFQFLSSKFFANSDFPKQVFQHAQELKFDQTMNLNLGLDQLFIKDYKAFGYKNGQLGEVELGYSVLLVSPKAFFDHFQINEIENKIDSFIEKNKLNGLFLMHAFPPENDPTNQLVQREFIFISSNDQIRQIVAAALKENNDSIVEVQVPLSESKFKQQFIAYQDKTSTLTRKIVEPLIKKAFD